jgi:drug/metabolite transporter (DMT)-like permease
MQPPPSAVHSTERWRVHAALLLVQVLFGLWPVAGAAVLREITPPALIGFRTVSAAPLLLAAAYGLKAARPSGADLARLAVLAFLGVTANQLLYAEGLSRSGPINAAVLMVIIPPMTLLLAMLLGDERPRARRVIGIGLALAGAAAVVGVDRFDLQSARFTGNLMIVGNVACYALYLVLARRVVPRVGALAAVAWVFCFGALEALPLTGPALLATPWSMLPSWVPWVLAFVVLGPTIGAYGLNAFALRHADASLVAVYVTLQPVLATLASWLWLEEVPTARVILSSPVIVAGVLLASRAER